MQDYSRSLRSMGESTAYTTKGHFKSADGRRTFIQILIIITILTSAASLLGDMIPEKGQRCINFMALFSSIALLYFQAKGDADYVSESMRAGNQYLSLHNDIQAAFLDKSSDKEQIETLRKQLNTLNESKRPHITGWAKRRAKHAIEVKGEMTDWWKEA